MSIRNVIEFPSQGSGFEGESFGMLISPSSGFLQTTFVYWNRILSQRRPGTIQPTIQLEVPAVGTN